MIILTIRTDKPEAEIGLYETEVSSMQHLDLDAMQGKGEQRTKSYTKYDEGVAQSLTQQSAKSTSGAASNAGRQAGVVRMIAYETWQAHRQLAETIHQKIESLLKSQKKDWSDVQGVVGFQGPGSFTGLRIGLTVANALAASLNAPIVGASGADWRQIGLALLAGGKNEKQIMPEYGSPVHITSPKIN